MIKRVLVSRIQDSILALEEACERAKVPYRLVEENGEPFTQLVDLAHARSVTARIFGWKPSATLLRRPTPDRPTPAAESKASYGFEDTIWILPVLFTGFGKRIAND